MKPDVISEQEEQKNGYNRPAQKRFSRKKLCWLLVIAFVIITVLLFFVANIYHKPDLNELLIRAKLAKLPESVKNLRVETRDARPVKANDRSEPKQCHLFIRFQAEPNDIDNFITSSPGIDKNNFRPLRPLPDGDDVPTWWATDQTTSGRMYFSHEQKYIHGTVAVYDDSNTVRICVWYIVNPLLLDMQENIEDMHDAFEDFLYDMLHEVLDLFD
jgi:hypothetical protein